ncbi:unnamed protein product [Menidia menidia]|uniref:(Atlantic silverside) hypothetical protein n=1 Tax=Menidia menidia TaxID=238744 RepID=A0A8S4BBL6_9TELE|nr:unnamed protein product [Menidia menidia]
MGSPGTVTTLFVILLVLVVLLIFLYKKLNREANNEYTVHRLVYKEGGLRDRARGAVFAVESSLGIQLWPRGDEVGEEMERVEEGQVEDGDSEGVETNEEEKEDEVEGDSTDQSGNAKEKSGDNSSLDSSEAGDQDRLLKEPEEKDETGEEREENQEKAEVEQAKADASGGTGLLINLKQFSGSAIWSEEGRGEGMGGDVTAL